jgi:hypothetical protein
MNTRFQFSCLAALFVAAVTAQAFSQELPAQVKEEGDSVLEQATTHMGRLTMTRSRGDLEVPLHPRPLLVFGDAARANKNGTVWAFGKSGRPLAMLELYQGTAADTNWIHAITLTGQTTVSLKTPLAGDWEPASLQIEPVAIPDAEAPQDREQRRTRQLRELARRFTAHEFWDPDNSRFELRLLPQPVHRYSDPEAGIHDGAAFVLAHGTNPELVLLIEALGKTPETARWHYSVARLGSAEMHVELDRKEVWKRDRTPGIAGQPTDPYWLFATPSEPAPAPATPPAKKK